MVAAMAGLIRLAVLLLAPAACGATASNISAVVQPPFPGTDFGHWDSSASPAIAVGVSSIVFCGFTGMLLCVACCLSFLVRPGKMAVLPEEEEPPALADGEPLPEPMPGLPHLSIEDIPAGGPMYDSRFSRGNTPQHSARPQQSARSESSYQASQYNVTMTGRSESSYQASQYDVPMTQRSESSYQPSQYNVTVSAPPSARFRNPMMSGRSEVSNWRPGAEAYNYDQPPSRQTSFAPSIAPSNYDVPSARSANLAHNSAGPQHGAQDWGAARAPPSDRSSYQASQYGSQYDMGSARNFSVAQSEAASNYDVPSARSANLPHNSAQVQHAGQEWAARPPPSGRSSYQASQYGLASARSRLSRALSKGSSYQASQYGNFSVAPSGGPSNYDVPSARSVNFPHNSAQMERPHTDNWGATRAPPSGRSSYQASQYGIASARSGQSYQASRYSIAGSEGPSNYDVGSVRSVNLPHDSAQIMHPEDWAARPPASGRSPRSEAGSFVPTEYSEQGRGHPAAPSEGPSRYDDVGSVRSVNFPHDSAQMQNQQDWRAARPPPSEVSYQASAYDAGSVRGGYSIAPSEGPSRYDDVGSVRSVNLPHDSAHLQHPEDWTAQAPPSGRSYQPSMYSHQPSQYEVGSIRGPSMAPSEGPSRYDDVGSVRSVNLPHDSAHLQHPEDWTAQAPPSGRSYQPSMYSHQPSQYGVGSARDPSKMAPSEGPSRYDDVGSVWSVNFPHDSAQPGHPEDWTVRAPPSERSYQPSAYGDSVRGGYSIAALSEGPSRYDDVGSVRSVNFPHDSAQPGHPEDWTVRAPPSERSYQPSAYGDSVRGGYSIAAPSEGPSRYDDVGSVRSVNFPHDSAQMQSPEDWTAVRAAQSERSFQASNYDGGYAASYQASNYGDASSMRGFSKIAPSEAPSNYDVGSVRSVNFPHDSAQPQHPDNWTVQRPPSEAPSRYDDVGSVLSVNFPHDSAQPGHPEDWTVRAPAAGRSPRSEAGSFMPTEYSEQGRSPRSVSFSQQNGPTAGWRSPPVGARNMGQQSTPSEASYQPSMYDVPSARPSVLPSEAASNYDVPSARSVNFPHGSAQVAHPNDWSQYEQAPRSPKGDEGSYQPSNYGGSHLGESSYAASAYHSPVSTPMQSHRSPRMAL